MKFNSGLPPWVWVPVGIGMGMGVGSLFGGASQGGVFTIVMGAIIGTGLGVCAYSVGKKREVAQDERDDKDI